MALRIWLHEGHDGEPKPVALALDFLGFSTWAGTEAELLATLEVLLHWKSILRILGEFRRTDPPKRSV